jgi:hypothetical protein
MIKEANCGIFAIPDGSTIHADKSDYSLALSIASRELIKLRRQSIEGMEAHDFAVESIMLCHRGGGKALIPFRTKRLILEKLRSETGLRRKNHINFIQSDGLNISSKKEYSNSDFEEMLSLIKVPSQMKSIIKMRVYSKMSFAEIGRVLSMSASGLSTYVGYWSSTVCDFLNEQDIKNGTCSLKKVKKRKVSNFKKKG